MCYHRLRFTPCLSHYPVFLGMVFLVLLTGLLAKTTQASSSDYAATLYMGRMTDAKAWHNLITHPDDVGFVNVNLLAGAISWTFANYWESDLSLELEGQVVRYFGDQDHWEFNVPVTARWKQFPWNGTVKTTAAFGLGPSYATQVPPIEVELEGDSQKFLVYWFVELTFGPPKANWTTVLRLHHRSTGFGALAEDGGSNSLAAGVKFSF